MYELPITVPIAGTVYNIRNKADYRVILDVIATYEDAELTHEEQILVSLIIFYECLDSTESVFDVFDTPELLENALQSMMSFIGCYNNDVGYKTQHKVIDWIQDEQLIVSAINNVARTEIRALEYLHWWTFISYYMAVGSCTLATVVSIRDKIARGKKLDDTERDFKRDNPQYFRWKSEQQQSDMLLKEIWNKD